MAAIRDRCVFVASSLVFVGAGIATVDVNSEARAAPPGVAAFVSAYGIPAADCAVSGTLADGSAEAGQAIYARRCKACHGVDGDGKGKRANALTKKPGALNTDESWGKTTDKFKFQSTKCGGKAVGKSDDMPDYPELTDQQIWDVLAYAKTLRSAGK